MFARHQRLRRQRRRHPRAENGPNQLGVVPVDLLRLPPNLRQFRGPKRPLCNSPQRHTTIPMRRLLQSLRQVQHLPNARQSPPHQAEVLLRRVLQVVPDGHRPGEASGKTRGRKASHVHDVREAFQDAISPVGARQVAPPGRTKEPVSMRPVPQKVWDQAESDGA